MQLTGRGSSGRRAVVRAATPLGGRRRAIACALAGAAALLLGATVAGAHNERHPGEGDGHGASVEHVTTSVLALSGKGHDDRGGGDDEGAAPGEHGHPHVVVPALATPSPAPIPSGRGLPITITSVGAPAPQPAPPSTGGTGAKPPSTVTTAVHSPAPAPAPRVPTSVVPVPAPGGGPPAPPPPSKPSATLPPLVLIPPLGLPTPPALNAVSGGPGVLPLVIVLLATGALGVTLAVRLARRSR